MIQRAKNRLKLLGEIKEGFGNYTCELDGVYAPEATFHGSNGDRFVKFILLED